MANETKKAPRKRAAKGKSTPPDTTSDAKKPNGQLPTEPPKGTPDDADFRFYTKGGHTHESLGLSEDDLVGMYRSMMLQRRFEERAAQMYGRQKISGFLHLYIGQEAVSTGTVQALQPADPIITAYRDHGLGLARGMTANECMAELFGKIDGSSRGKGGSMHFFDVEHHFYGGHGIVGGQIPVAVGLGFAAKYKETGNVAVGFFGDGAINQGAFHEAANLASLYDIPVLLCCENNAYGMGTSVERSTAQPELYKKAYAYDMTGAVVNGMDVFEVYYAMSELAKQAREQNRPALVDIRTYRYRGHSMSDPQKYRTKEEMESKKNEDPIIRLKSYIVDQGFSDNEALDGIDEEVKQVVLESVEFAENSPFPPVETMYEDVYVQDDYPFIV
ncbi:MAG: pyruvate dehydrogenase (acetyl-transferring) E1 component subunit alpha [Rhodothermales bacterium]